MEVLSAWFNQQEQEGRFSFTYANTEEELIHHLDNDPVDVLYIEDTNQSIDVGI